MSDRDRNRAAERRAEQIGWRKRAPGMSQASRTMDEHLRRHGAESGDWHRKWDDPARMG